MAAAEHRAAVQRLDHLLGVGSLPPAPQHRQDT